MFVGHFAVGFAAKRVLPRTPLPVLFAAVQLADTLWPVLVALGLEEVRIDPGNTAFTALDFVAYPYSHSLATLVVWGALFGVMVAVWMPEARVRTAVTIAALVVSHWLLDWLTHRPDMPIYPGGPRVGLGLWNSVPLTLVVESTIFAVGLWLYSSATRAVDRTGGWAFGALVAFLCLAYVSGIGAAPPSVTAVWTVSLLGAVLVLLWAWWVERHRVAIRPSPRTTAGFAR